MFKQNKAAKRSLAIEPINLVVVLADTAPVGCGQSCILRRLIACAGARASSPRRKSCRGLH